MIVVFVDTHRACRLTTFACPTFAPTKVKSLPARRLLSSSQSEQIERDLRRELGRIYYYYTVSDYCGVGRVYNESFCAARQQRKLLFDSRAERKVGKRQRRHGIGIRWGVWHIAVE